MQAGQRLGPYSLRREIGEGGIAQVFLAEDTRKHVDVVVKVLRVEHLSNAATVALFLEEPRALMMVEHENTIEVTHVVDAGDVGDDAVGADGAPYFITELLRGRTLADVVRGGPVALPRALTIMRQSAVVLAHAHDVNVVHRNLKPANIFLIRDDNKLDFVKLLELGATRMQSHEGKPVRGTVIGTPAYMAPEQLRQQPGDHRVDMYSFGVILFELACGRRPFVGDLADIIRHHLLVRAPRARELVPDIPPALDDLIANCLRKDPAERPPSMHEVSLALGVLSDDIGAPRGLTDDVGRSIAVPKNTSGYTTVVADATVAPTPVAFLDEDEPSFPSVTAEHAALTSGQVPLTAPKPVPMPVPKITATTSATLETTVPMSPTPPKSPPLSTQTHPQQRAVASTPPDKPLWNVPTEFPTAPPTGMSESARKVPVQALLAATAVVAVVVGIAIGSHFSGGGATTSDAGATTPTTPTTDAGTIDTTTTPPTPTTPTTPTSPTSPTSPTPPLAPLSPTTVVPNGQELVTFDSDPRGAQVFVRIDKKIRLLCNTPCTFTLPAGKEILVEERRDGYRSAQKTMMVEKGAKFVGVLKKH